MFVGITTAPRKQSTISHTLQSVRDCGYEPIVFAEPASKPTDAKTITHPKPLGIWKNWLSMCRWALERDYDTFVTLQDDIDLHPDTLSFTQEVTIPGILSLYTSRYHGRGRKPGVHHIKTRHLWGACALAFSRPILEKIITHSRVESWGHKGGQDVVISNIANDLEIPIHFVCPSPVAHISKTSSVGHGDNSGNRNCAVQADKTIPLEEVVWPS